MSEANNSAPSDEPATAQPLPGAVVMPGSATAAPVPAPVGTTPVPAAPLPTPEPAQDTPFAKSTEAAAQSLALASPAAETVDDDPGSITWTASEFIAHEKSVGWYFGLAVTAVAVSAFIYVVTKDKVSPIAVVVAAVTFGFYGARKPRQLQYNVDNNGITIGSKHFLYEAFRSFSIVPEGAFSSIVFMPLKRFGLTLTLYYAPADEEKIVNIISDKLPLEERGLDSIDKLMHRIRF